MQYHFIERIKITFLITIILSTFSVNGQHRWGQKPIELGYFLFSSKSFTPSIRYFDLVYFYPNLNALNLKSEFYNISSSLRLNYSGAEKMLVNFMIDNPTSNIAESAYFDLANFYYYKGKYSYALTWFKKISSSDVDFYSKDEYYFNKGHTLFSTKQFKSSRQFFEKVKDVPKYEYDVNYYLGYISYQLDDYELAAENFSKLNDKDNKFKIGYFQADMNFKLGRFEEAIKIGLINLKNVSKKEYSDLSKIIGESYFNMNNFTSALSFLKEYKGKKGKWNNTDFYQLGYTFYNLKQYKEAIGQFNKIVSGKDELAQNAYYYLADCYLKMNLKSSALNAFKSATSLKFDSTIAEDAQLNYAKLSYEIGNPYESPTEVLKNFIKTYPKNELIEEIKILLINSYVSNKNHDEALVILDKESGSAYYEPLQKVTYMKGVDSYRLGLYSESISYFNRSLKISKSPIINAMCLYWKAQSLYEINDYDSALTFYNKFNSHPEAKNLVNYEFLNYNLAYSYFKKKEYNSAIKYFDVFINQKHNESKYQNDAVLRLADSYFSIKEYWPAMDNYLNILLKQINKSDYALYQIAVSYGFVNRLEKKIESLDRLIKNFPSSTLIDDALFELALTYVSQNNNLKAVEVYDNIIKFYDSSPYRSKSLLNKALILYNNDSLSESLNILKRLVETYPRESISNQALIKAKEISIDLAQVEKFAEWLKEINITSISNNEIEVATFISAEKLFKENKKKSALRAFESYLEKYPSSSNNLKVNFYLAEIYFEETKWEESLLFYKKIINTSVNEFTEQALVRMTQAFSSLNRRNEALHLWQDLEDIAQFTENKNYAKFNLMKLYFEQKKHQSSIEYAEEILKIDFLEEKVKWDALYILAKSYENLNDINNASVVFKKLENSPQDEVALEAIFFNATQENLKNNYRESNLLIEKISQNYSGYPIWSSRSLLLMSNNFYKLNDAFQATFILESIINNFSQFPKIVNEAKLNLDNIKDIEFNYNSSINDNKYEDEL